jgi:hypothetical protein
VVIAEGRGPFLQTFTGKPFYPFDPRVEDFELETVAHALAHECRWSGHTVRFYPVAQHALDVSSRLERYGAMTALAGLHHDDSEAYLRDVPRPIKHHPSMAPYRAAEKKVQTLAYEAFGIVRDEVDWNLLTLADDDALAWEAYALLEGGPQGWAPLGDSTPPPQLGVPLPAALLEPGLVELRFLRRHDELVKRILSP